MLREKLVTQVTKFLHNHTLSFSAFNLFLIVTEGVVVTEADFPPWLDEQAQRLKLVVGKHYRYSGLDTKITGNAALTILADQDNEIGAYARRIRKAHGWVDIRAFSTKKD